jgi:hypothetical protein
MQKEEPPSPRGRKHIHLTRRLRVTINSIPRRLPTLVPVAIVLTLLTAVSVNAYSDWRIMSTPQEAADSERVAFTLSNYLQPDTLQPAETASDFSSIAFAGQNVGGLPNNEASLTQHIVAGGETLSTIAEQYGLKMGTVILANKEVVSDSELIHPGQVLLIPEQDASKEAIAAEYNAREQKRQAEAKTAVKKVTSASVATGSAPFKLSSPLGSFDYKSQGFNASNHPGIDYAVDPGTSLRAVADGCVVLASTGWNGGYGTTLILDIGGGYTVRYAHMKGFVSGITSGTCFAAGERIGYSGNSGRSTGPHLHFEVRYNGVPKNPVNFGL